MSKHIAKISWARNGSIFTDKKYSRAHAWSFDGGAHVAASSSPHNVPLPYSVAANVDPEEAYVAALSSCHMLWFLSIAAQRGFVVDSYVDAAEGIMEKDAAGKWWMTRVSLKPEITWSGATPGAQDVDALHHEAHAQCFLANSVKTEIIIAAANPSP